MMVYTEIIDQSSDMTANVTRFIQYMPLQIIYLSLKINKCKNLYTPRLVTSPNI
jgi:hypothetical protein